MRNFVCLAAAGLMAAGALGGCGRLGPQMAISQSGYVAPDRSGVCNTGAATGRLDTSPFCRFVRDYETSFSAPDDTRKAQALLDSGYTYAGLICSNYFNILADGNQILNFRREGVTLAGGFLSALGGLTGTPADHIAIVNTGIAATVAGMESYQEHYYFGPSVLTVRRLVTGAQANYAATVTTDEVKSGLDFSGAVRHIDAYQALCQVDTIQGFVDEAVSNQQVVFASDARDFTLSDVAFRSALDDVADALEAADNLDASQLAVLAYVRRYGLPSRAVQEHVIRPVVGGAVYDEIVDAAGRLAAPDALRAALDAATARLDAQANERLNQRVQALRTLVIDVEAQGADSGIRSAEALQDLLALAGAPFGGSTRTAPQAVLVDR